jgi:hypothetical protein
LRSDIFQKLFLFPTLIFYFLFHEFNKFFAVGRVSRNNFELSGFLFGEWFSGGWYVFGVEDNLFEDSGLEILLLVVLSEFDMSS